MDVTPLLEKGLTIRDVKPWASQHGGRDGEMAGLVGVEERVTAARLLREAKAAKAQERKTKLAVNKAAKAAAAGYGRPVEGNTTL